KGLAGTGDAEKYLMLVAGCDAGGKLIDGGRLISARLVVAVQLEFHREGLLPVLPGMAETFIILRHASPGIFKSCCAARISSRGSPAGFARHGRNFHYTPSCKPGDFLTRRGTLP